MSFTGEILCDNLFVLFCDHTLTLQNHEAHHCTFWHLWKALTRGYACLSFHIFKTNETRVIEFRMMFLLKIDLRL